MADRLEITKLFYAAFASGDRAFVERTITDDFTFSSPPRQEGADGRVDKGRNTEVLTFEGDRISRAEVYFGWSEPE